jgi:hypothetical protein
LRRQSQPASPEDRSDVSILVGDVYPAPCSVQFPETIHKGEVGDGFEPVTESLHGVPFTLDSKQAVFEASYQRSNRTAEPMAGDPTRKIGSVVLTR